MNVKNKTEFLDNTLFFSAHRLYPCSSLDVSMWPDLSSERDWVMHRTFVDLE